MERITEIKRALTLMEAEGKRLPTYDFLRVCWENETRTEVLTVLSMRQMVCLLMKLEEPPVEWEEEDEYAQYADFLQEILRYGMNEFGEGKQFLWQLCFYLSAYGTYHFILGGTIPVGTEKALLSELLARAKALYPQSRLFDLIPRLMGNAPDAEPLTEADTQAIQDELTEWALRDNWADAAQRERFKWIGV